MFFLSTAAQYLFHWPVLINLQYGHALVLYLNGGWAKANKNKQTPSEKTSQAGSWSVLIRPDTYNSGAKYPRVPDERGTNPA